MATVKLLKRVDLSNLGEGWQGCYIEFRSPSYGEIKSFLPKIQAEDRDEGISAGLDLFTKLFVSGKVLTDSGIAELVKEEIPNLPMEIINRCYTEMAGGISPLAPPQT